MALDAKLKEQGWFLTPEGIENCLGTDSTKERDVGTVIKRALDLDLKNIGASVLPTDVNRFKKGSIPDKCVLQVTKVTNVSAPKSNEESNAAPRLLRIHLVDGHSTIAVLDLEGLKTIGLNTPPGTKVKLNGADTTFQHGFFIVNKSNFEVLGGNVEALVEKWKLNQSLANYSRRGADNSEGGAPKWVPFGQKINSADVTISEKKCLETVASKENDAFEQQRKAKIEVAMKAKGVGKKQFGCGKQIADRNDTSHAPKVNDVHGSKQSNFARMDFKERREERQQRSERPNRGKGNRDDRRDEDGDLISAVPSKPSTLFDFLESKIPNIGGKSAAKETAASIHNSVNINSNSNSNNINSNSRVETQGSTRNQTNPNNVGHARYQRDANDSGRLDYRGRNNLESREKTRSSYQSNQNAVNKSSTAYGRERGPSSSLSAPSSAGNDRNLSATNNTTKKSNFGVQQARETRFGSNSVSPAINANTQSSRNTIGNNYVSKYQQQSGENGRQPYRDGRREGGGSRELNSLSSSSPLSWKPGEFCIAKYWEDNKFYPATVHAVAPNGSTCVVFFSQYGNYEEVLVKDIRPSSQKQRSDRSQSGFQTTTTSSGTVEYRRGGTRPYVVRNPLQLAQEDRDNRTHGPTTNRQSQPVYVPPAQRQV